MRLAAISDTHRQLRDIQPPVCDVLVHAGDMLGSGSMAELNSELRILTNNFAPWCKHIVIIAGNHDRIWEDNPAYAKSQFDIYATRALQEHGCQLHYLQDSIVEIDGVTFFGSPWQPEFFSWAFNLPRKGEELRRRWADIPEGVDVLLTHSPPYGILDIPGGRSGVNEDSTVRHVGCELLAEAVKRVKPQVHVFGHVHHTCGVRVEDGVLYINASTCDESYKPTRGAVYFELQPR